MENERHKLLRDFEIQTDHLISTSRLERVIVNKIKRTFRIVDVDLPADHRVKVKDNEKVNNNNNNNSKDKQKKRKELFYDEYCILGKNNQENLVRKKHSITPKH